MVCSACGNFLYENHWGIVSFRDIGVCPSCGADKSVFFPRTMRLRDRNLSIELNDSWETRSEDVVSRCSYCGREKTGKVCRGCGAE